MYNMLAMIRNYYLKETQELVRALNDILSVDVSPIELGQLQIGYQLTTPQTKFGLIPVTTKVQFNTVKALIEDRKDMDYTILTSYEDSHYTTDDYEVISLALPKDTIQTTQLWNKFIALREKIKEELKGNISALSKEQLLILDALNSNLTLTVDELLKVTGESSNSLDYNLKVLIAGDFISQMSRGLCDKEFCYVLNESKELLQENLTNQLVTVDNLPLELMRNKISDVTTLTDADLNALSVLFNHGIIISSEVRLDHIKDNLDLKDVKRSLNAVLSHIKSSEVLNYLADKFPNQMWCELYNFIKEGPVLHRDITAYYMCETRVIQDMIKVLFEAGLVRKFKPTNSPSGQFYCTPEYDTSNLTLSTYKSHLPLKDNVLEIIGNGLVRHYYLSNDKCVEEIANGNIVAIVEYGNYYYCKPEFEEYYKLSLGVSRIKPTIEQQNIMKLLDSTMLTAKDVAKALEFTESSTNRDLKFLIDNKLIGRTNTFYTYKDQKKRKQKQATFVYHKVTTLPTEAELNVVTSKIKKN